MIALVLLLRYSLLLLGFGRSPFCKREMRERESKGGESFFFGGDYDVSFVPFFFFFFLLLLLLLLLLSCEQG